MYSVKSVEPLPGYKLKLKFDNDEFRIFDMQSYLEHGIFAQLKDEKIFQSVKVSFDTVEWLNGADLCPDVLYNESIKLD